MTNNIEIIHKDVRAIQWLNYFMDMAKLVSTMSKDPHHKIGAVIVNKDNHVVSMGFNGFAHGVKDTVERLNNKDIKRKLMLHAEENAILHAKQDLSECDIYIYGYPPCTHCMSLIIQAGIKCVYYRNSNKDSKVSEYWKADLELAEKLGEELEIPILGM